MNYLPFCFHRPGMSVLALIGAAIAALLLVPAALVIILLPVRTVEWLLDGTPGV
jgi:hypothetical protein